MFALLQKPTFTGVSGMSALCQFQTFAELCTQRPLALEE